MSGYCKYCDSQTNSIIEVFENGMLVWTGCGYCYLKKIKKKELANNAAEPQ